MGKARVKRILAERMILWKPMYVLFRSVGSHRVVVGVAEALQFYPTRWVIFGSLTPTTRERNSGMCTSK